MSNPPRYKGKFRYEFLHVVYAACVMEPFRIDELAFLVGVTEPTFKKWLIKYPELSRAIRKGRAMFIVENQYEIAIGKNKELKKLKKHPILIEAKGLSIYRIWDEIDKYVPDCELNLQ